MKEVLLLLSHRFDVPPIGVVRIDEKFIKYLEHSVLVPDVVIKDGVREIRSFSLIFKTNRI